MPQVVSDPSLNPGIILNGGTSLFAFPDTPAASILSFQAVPTQPLPDGVTTATGLLVPDLQLSQRLRNFPPEIYDLAPSSVLSHFMQALLGDAGAGQLRKRQTVARLQSAVTSTSFYDLDSFYGALFGAIRGPSGSLPINPGTGVTFTPYSDLASQDGWDEIEAIDAKFRERIVALARAITLGGTVPGMQALGEAIAGVPCDVWEVWRLIDTQGAEGSGNIWTTVEADWADWDSFPAGFMWQQLEGFIDFGGLGINARSEVIIQPRKSYPSTPAGLTEQASDLYGISRVCEVLQPAEALLTVNIKGIDPQIPVPIPAIWSDSEYWDIVQYVTPADIDDPAYAPGVSSYQKGGQPTGATFPQPSPPLSRHQGTQISYVSDVTTVQAEALDADSSVDNTADYEQVVFPAGTVSYLPRLAVMEQARAASARLASSVSVTAAPYSGPRIPVQTAG